MESLLLVLFAYLLGSVLFGNIVAKLKGVNLREVGSGNVGATNVSRALGKKFGIIVFFLDMLKGFIPTYIAVSNYGLESKTLMFVGIASVLGHMFSVFDNFRGGKGVATAFGVLLAVSLKVAFISFVVWAFILYKKRFVSLASIGASLLSPFILLILGYPVHTFLMSSVIALLIVYKHMPNIDRLLSGKEPKV